MAETYQVATQPIGGGAEIIIVAAVPGVVRDELNGPGSFDFELGLLDAQALNCKPFEREVVVRRGNDVIPIFMGPITSDPWSAGGAIRFSAEGLLAYTGGRFLDRGAGRINLLTNSSFEAAPALTGWTSVNVTSAVSALHTVEGGQSAMLTRATAGGDSYLQQQVTLTAGGVGEVVTLAFWYYIDPATWIDPAFESRGLYLARRVSPAGAYIGQPEIIPIDRDSRRAVPQRVQVTVQLPVGATETLEVRLYAVGGTIWWDAGSLTLMESVSNLDIDQANIAASYITHIQNVAFGWPNNINIATAPVATGVKRTITHQFADHTSVQQALTQLAKLYNGFDFDISMNRVFRTFYPRKGTDRSANVTLTGDSNCLVQARTFDGPQAADRVVTLGEDDGPDREEGFASDTAALGNFATQRVLLPPTGLPVGALNQYASQELDIAKRPYYYRVKTLDPQHTNQLFIGDIVTFVANHGYIQATGKHRIVQRELNTKDDTLILTLNGVRPDLVLPV